MQELFVQFDKPMDLKQVSLVLRRSGVFQPDVEVLDSERREQYLPLLAPARSKASGALRVCFICVVTTIFGLMAVIVDNVGYILSLLAAAVVWLTLRRKPATESAQVMSVRVEASDTEAAKSSLLQFGAVAILGPVA